MSDYPVWAEIDLNAVAHNVREVRRVTSPSARVMAVVKGNGYGHGAVAVSRTAIANGAEWLGVARVAEGVSLRDAGIDVPILVMSYITPGQSSEVIRCGLAQAVYNKEMAETLAGVASASGSRAKVHLKVDTGMGRIGWLAVPSTVKEILELARLPSLDIEGIFTHFATADETDKGYAWEQLDKFHCIVNELSRHGLEIPVRHASNSAAVMEMHRAHLDMVRAGIVLYGLYPSDQVDRGTIRLRPAMSLKARVAHVKEVPAGFKVSYGCTFVTEKSTVIATLPLGYADGYSRLLSNKGHALIHGCRSPVVGRVCMDQTMVDAGHIEGVKAGDEAVLIGRQGDQVILADDIARKVGTINYEIVCMVNHRVPRVYSGGE